MHADFMPDLHTTVERSTGNKNAGLLVGHDSNTVQALSLQYQQDSCHGNAISRDVKST